MTEEVGTDTVKSIEVEVAIEHSSQEL